MATARQKSANAKNAKASTGPRSAAGRTKSSKNATSHGLTTPLAEEDVLRQLRIVTGDPAMTPDELGDDELGYATWELSVARAEYDRAIAAERHCANDLARLTRTHGEHDSFHLDLDDLDDPAVLVDLMERGGSDKFTEQGLRLLIASNGNGLPKQAKRLERVDRYVRRAERRRKKAFAAWMRARNGKIDKTNPNTLSG